MQKKNLKDKNGDTPLHNACRNGHLHVVDYLIDKCGAYEDPINNKKETPFLIASKSNNIFIQNYFINKFNYPKNFEPNIFKACQKGDLESLKYLIEKCDFDINSSNESNQSLLHLATNSGNLTMIEYLISKGENIEIKDNNESTPLLYACKMYNRPIVEYLISKGANIGAKDKSGNFTIHIAAQNGQLEIVQYLIEKQNVDKDMKGYKETTPLHLASQKGHLPIVEYLISKDANIEAKDELGRTPLYYACENNQQSIIEFLISKDADINAKDKNGNDPLNIAYKNNQKIILEYAHSKYGYPPRLETNIFKATEEGKLESVQWLIEKENVDKNKRVQKEDNEDKYFYKGDTPIHIAAQNGRLSIVQYLIEKQNVDIEIKGQLEHTPLHYACENAQLSIAKYLISKGANLEARDAIKRTPLHIASERNHLNLVKYLISIGADKDSIDVNGKTPYDSTKNDKIKRLFK